MQSLWESSAQFILDLRQKNNYNRNTCTLLYKTIHRPTCTCSSFFLGNVTALGVLCCFALFVCLILLASFFLLISHLKTCIHIYIYIIQYNICIRHPREVIFALDVLLCFVVCMALLASFFLPSSLITCSMYIMYMYMYIPVRLHLVGEGFGEDASPTESSRDDQTLLQTVEHVS